MSESKGKGHLDKLLSLILLGGGAVCAVLILTVPKQAADDGHGHGGEKEEGGHDGGKEEGSHEGAEAGHVEGSEAIALDDDQVEAAGIELVDAAPATVLSLLRVRGQVAVNRDRHAEISPRFGGIVTRSFKRLGDRVRRGETLAVIESAASRAAVDLRSGLDGTVTAVNVGPGAFASEKEAVFAITDLSNVWAEFRVSELEAARIKVGQSVTVREAMGESTAKGLVSFVAPIVDEDTQSLLVRTVIDNPDGKWRPGAFIEGEISLGEVAAPVAVRRSAVHELQGDDVVFVRHEDGDAFSIRPVKLGRYDNELVEVVEGIKPGEKYAASNSYLVKAELLKSEAGHGH